MCAVWLKAIVRLAGEAFADPAGMLCAEVPTAQRRDAHKATTAEGRGRVCM